MGLDLEKLKERLSKRTSDRRDRFNFIDGDNYIRILPPSLEYITEGVDYIAYEYKMHFNLGVEGDKKAEICPKSLGRSHRCPICEVVYKLYKSDNPDDVRIAKDIKASDKYIFNIIDLNNIERGIQIMEAGQKIYEDVIVYITNPKWGNLLDIDTGRNVTITKIPKKETKSGYPKYSVTFDPERTSIQEKLPKNYKEALDQLSKQISKPKSYEELKAVLEGTFNDEKSTKKEPESVAPVVYSPKIEEDTEKKSQPVIEVDLPVCFGLDYSPKRPLCIDCNITVKQDCRKKFLEL